MNKFLAIVFALCLSFAGCTTSANASDSRVITKDTTNPYVITKNSPRSVGFSITIGNSHRYSKSPYYYRYGKRHYYKHYKWVRVKVPYYSYHRYRARIPYYTRYYNKSTKKWVTITKWRYGWKTRKYIRYRYEWRKYYY